MSNACRLSVILPTRNGESVIQDQLDALRRQSWHRPWEIIFVNNGSDDNTRKIIENAIPDLPTTARIVDADEHFSLAFARNYGVSKASGRSVAFCDDDDLVADDWVAQLGEILETAQFVASSFEYHRLNDEKFARTRGRFQSDELGTCMGISVASGGGSAIRRSLWDQVDGNSLDFYRSGEDLDFSLRVTKNSGVIPVLCAAAVYHVRLRGDGRDTFKQAKRFAEATVALYSVHGKPANVKPDGVLLVARHWLGLVKRSPQLLTSTGRLAWTWQLGKRIGHVTGSLKHRVYYP